MTTPLPPLLRCADEYLSGLTDPKGMTAVRDDARTVLHDATGDKLAEYLQLRIPGRGQDTANSLPAPRLPRASSVAHPAIGARAESARPALGDTLQVAVLPAALCASVDGLSLYGHVPFGMPEGLELLVSAVAVPVASIIAAQLARPVLAPRAA